MIINPVYALFLLYLCANFIAMFLGVLNGGMVLEGVYFSLRAKSLIFSFLVQFLMLFGFVFLYGFFRSKLNIRKLELGLAAGIFLLIVQAAFVVFNIHMGVNVAGSGERIEGGSIVNYIFIFLQPDILFLIIGISLASDRLFLLNAILFMVSMFLRGWMGGFFILIFMFLCRFYPVRVSVRNMLYFCLFVLVIPVIIDAKWAMRLDVPLGDFLMNVSASFDLQKYQLALTYLLNRFQHVGHVALLMEQSDKIYADYRSGEFISYWLDGLPQYTILKFIGLESFKINSYIVEQFFGVTERSWNTNPGIAGWVFVLQERFVFLVIYLALIFVIPFYFISKYAGNYLLMLVCCFSITYLFHGWVGAYFNIVFYAIALVFISKAKIHYEHRASSVRIECAPKA